MHPTGPGYHEIDLPLPAATIVMNSATFSPGKRTRSTFKLTNPKWRNSCCGTVVG